MYWYCLLYWKEGRKEGRIDYRGGPSIGNASDCLIIDMIVHMVALGPALLLREIQLNREIYQNIKLFIHPLNLFSFA